MADCAGQGQLCLPSECERSGAVLFEGVALARSGDRKVELSDRNCQVNNRTDVETGNRRRELYYLGGNS